MPGTSTMYPYQDRSTVAPVWKPVPLTMIGVPGGAAGGRSVIVGEFAAWTFIGIIMKLPIDNVRIKVSKIATELWLCWFIFFTFYVLLHTRGNL
jgi:hypothetical protein